MALASLEGCVFILLGISLAGAIPAGKYLEVEDDDDDDEKINFRISFGNFI